MIEDQVIDIISTSLNLQKGVVSLDTEIRSLGVDSMKIFEIILKVEKKYGIEMPDNATYKIKTTREFVNLVTSLCDNPEAITAN